MARKKQENAQAEDFPYIAESLWPLAVLCDELTLDPANARKHDERNLDAIKGSLAVYRQVKPVVVRRDNNVVVAGNGTLQAARALGWTHVAAVFVDMDAATAAGFAIADNRTAELSEWDVAALEALLRDINTGNDERLDRMLSELAAETGDIEFGEDIISLGDYPSITATTQHTLTLRYDDNDEIAIKRFIGQASVGPLEPIHAGAKVVARIREVVATGADTESGGAPSS